MAQWAGEMAKIGYGQTKRQICETVKKILDKDQRLNPFPDNRPGGMAFLPDRNLLCVLPRPWNPIEPQLVLKRSYVNGIMILNSSFLLME